MTLAASLAILLLLPAAAEAAPIRVVLLGDSITVGQVSGSGGLPYAELLPNLLGPGYEVSNIACGGSSSLDWTVSQGSSLCGSLDLPPDIYTSRAVPELPAAVVTILLGTNDAIGFFEPEPVAPEDYGAALAEIAANLLEDGAEHVLLMTAPKNFNNPFLNLSLIAYRDEVIDLCGSMPGVACGPDVFTLLSAESFDDGDIHPNAAGHEIIATALAYSVSQLAPVPEPGTLPLLLAGIAMLAAGRPGRWH